MCLVVFMKCVWIIAAMIFVFVIAVMMCVGDCCCTVCVCYRWHDICW